MAVAITQTAQLTTSDSSGLSGSDFVVTYNNRSIGTAASDRVVILNATSENGGMTGLTAEIDIGGGFVSMNAVAAAVSFGSLFIRQFYYEVPSGTTASFRITHIGSGLSSDTSTGGSVYAVTGGAIQSSGSDSSTDMDSSDPLTTGSITIPSDGALLAAVAGAGNTAGRYTWSNASEDVDYDEGNYAHSVALRTTAGTVTVTCTGDTTGEDGVLSFIIFEATAVASPGNFFAMF